jgi:hypothetical protein
MKTKKVTELVKGDKVKLESGGIVTISSVEKGLLPNSKLLHYSNGQWGCMRNNDEVEIFN